MQRPSRNTEGYRALAPETSPVDPMVEFRLNKNFAWLQHELDKMPVRKDPDTNPAVADQRSQLWEWNELLRHTIQDIQTDTLTLLYAPQEPVEKPTEKPQCMYVPVVPGRHPKKICETIEQAQEELFRYAESLGFHKPTRSMDDPQVKYLREWIEQPNPEDEIDKEIRDNPELFNELIDAVRWYRLMSQCIIHELPVEYLEKM